MIEPGQSLGLMIRGGIEYGLGIYVTGVDKDSVADRAGLNVRVYKLLSNPYSDSLPSCIYRSVIKFLRSMDNLS